MWKLFAIEALHRGHSVAATLQTPIAQSEELAEFRALGGVVFAYNPLHRTPRVPFSGVFPVLEIEAVESGNHMHLWPPGHPISRSRSLQTAKRPRSPEFSSYKATLIGLSVVNRNAMGCERFIARRGESSASRGIMRAIAKTTNIDSAYYNFIQSNQNTVGASVTLAW